MGQVDPEVLMEEKGEGAGRRRDCVMNHYPTTEEIRIRDGCPVEYPLGNGKIRLLVQITKIHSY